METPGEATSAQSATTARCETHGLSYPATEAGCVLCRRSGRSAPEPGTIAGPNRWLAAGVVVSIVLLGAVLVRPKSVIEVGVSGAVTKNDDFIDCIEDCRSLCDKCDALCLKEDPDPRCRQGCLMGNAQCAQRCSLSEHGTLDGDLAMYWSGPLPAWDEVLMAMRPTLADAQECPAQDRSVLLRISASSGGGRPLDMVVASPRSDLEHEACVRKALEALSLPSAPKPYSFVTLASLSEDALDQAVRIADRQLTKANEEGDDDAIARAQKRVWLLRAKVEERQQEARLAAQRQSEEAAKKAAEGQQAYRGSWNGYRYQPPYRPPPPPPAPRKAKKTPEYRANDSNVRYENRQAAMDAERMRQERIREERDEEMRKQERVRRLDRNANRQQMQRELGGW